MEQSFKLKNLTNLNVTELIKKGRLKNMSKLNVSELIKRGRFKRIWQN